MMKTTFHILTIAGVFALASLMMPATSQAGCGCHAAAVAPVYAAPTTAYMPTTVYQALYAPTVTTAYMPAYQPAGAYNAYTSYAVTTYRPLFGFGYRARLVPYTAYQPVYAAAPVVAYSGCSTCANYGSYEMPIASGCSTCANYGSYEVPTCSGCSSCGVVSDAMPTSTCSSCAAASVAPATTVTPAPQSATPPSTFQENVQKPTTNADPKPIPQTETHLNSMPSPLLPDPSDRTASRPVYSSARVLLVAHPTDNNDGWQPARD
jgi:hypothetical protein